MWAETLAVLKAEYSAVPTVALRVELKAALKAA